MFILFGCFDPIQWENIENPLDWIDIKTRAQIWRTRKIIERDREREKKNVVFPAFFFFYYLFFVCLLSMDAIVLLCCFCQVDV